MRKKDELVMKALDADQGKEQIPGLSERRPPRQAWCRGVNTSLNLRRSTRECSGP